MISYYDLGMYRVLYGMFYLSLSTTILEVDREFLKNHTPPLRIMSKKLQVRKKKYPECSGIHSNIDSHVCKKENLPFLRKRYCFEFGYRWSGESIIVSSSTNCLWTGSNTQPKGTTKKANLGYDFRCLWTGPKCQVVDPSDRSTTTHL